MRLVRCLVRKEAKDVLLLLVASLHGPQTHPSINVLVSQDSFAVQDNRLMPAIGVVVVVVVKVCNFAGLAAKSTA